MWPSSKAVFTSTAWWWVQKAMTSERSIVLQMSFLVAKLDMKIKGKAQFYVPTSTLTKRTLSCLIYSLWRNKVDVF